MFPLRLFLIATISARSNIQYDLFKRIGIFILLGLSEIVPDLDFGTTCDTTLFGGPDSRSELISFFRKSWPPPPPSCHLPIYPLLLSYQLPHGHPTLNYQLLSRPTTINRGRYNPLLKGGQRHFYHGYHFSMGDAWTLGFIQKEVRSRFLNPHPRVGCLVSYQLDPPPLQIGTPFGLDEFEHRLNSFSGMKEQSLGKWKNTVMMK